ncbi:MAG: aminotransferase class I/II-fold pyridoxal phosphate-dependent enzyme, partial [Candidatus Hodarchaeota archaeon]
ASIAREYKIIILSDEIYALISFKGHVHHSIAEYYSEGTIVTGGLSKDRSLGGFRLGVMLIPEEEKKLSNAILSIGSETWSCASAPIQYASIEAYKPNPVILNHIKDCTSIHQIVINYAHNRFIEMGIRCSKPQGAFYLFPDWNKYKSYLREKQILSSIDLSKTLLKEWNVATLAGFEFGMPENDLCVRFSPVDYDGAKALEIFQENRNYAFNNSEEFVIKVAPNVIYACNQIEKFTDSIKLNKDS